MVIGWSREYLKLIFVEVTVADLAVPARQDMADEKGDAVPQVLICSCRGDHLRKRELVQ